MNGVTTPTLAVGCYSLDFTSASPVRFSEFPGSAWRGALGHALRRIACVTREKECRACMLYRTCTYSYIFETPPPVHAAKMRKYNHVPHPFVLALDEVRDPCCCRLRLNLFGDGNRHLPLFVYALTEAGKSPRGIAGNRLTLTSVSQSVEAGGADQHKIYEAGGDLLPLPVGIAPVPPAPSALRLQFETPLRLKRDGTHVGPRDFHFADLFVNLLRRISMLTSFHTDTALDVDFRGMRDAALGIICNATDLTWKDLERYSARQQTDMKMGGLLGSVSLEGQDIAPFWPYLWLGQWVHAGTAATMGLGLYRVIASLPNGHGVAHGHTIMP